MLTEERRVRLARILQREITEAESARFPLTMRWKENIRQYEGIPRVAVKNYPIENAPNTELNISGTVVDTIYAQALDILWGIEPLVMVRASGTNGAFSDCAADIQILANRLAGNELALRQASNHSLLDCIKHGTGLTYTPWTERVRYTDIARITSRGPRAFSPPLEDWLVPGGAETFDEFLPWLGIRNWRTATQLDVMVRTAGWKLDGAQKTASTNYTRTAREQAGMTRPSTQRIGELYDIWMLYGTFDVDGDGIERDLLVYYNFSGNRVLHATWNPYDVMPANLSQYQLREHLIYALGTVEMCSQFQESATTILNENLANMMLANTRMYTGPAGSVPGDTIRARPGKFIGTTGGNQITELKMSDVYPSGLASLGVLGQMWERRTGVNEVSSPRPSSMLGNRTPGITAMTLMQAANRRFATAFDSMRDATAGCVWQGLMRYHERIRMGDALAIQHIQAMFPDPERGGSVVAALKDPTFDDGMIVEMQATSATANQMQDRQEMVQLAGILGAYYDKSLQLIAVASQQGIAEPVREVALKVAHGTAEIIKRTLQKFDQIRDAEALVLDLEAQINALPAAPPAILGQLGSALGLAGSGGGDGGQGGSGVAGEGSNNGSGPSIH